jgi:BirA family biotin operon repressor/biotin-[acetyl-CoA-carboxylase] ligase
MTDPQESPRSPAGTAHPNWGAEALWQALVPLLPGLSIEVVEKLDSTNSELVDRLKNASKSQRAGRDGREEDLFPQLLVANQQTAGRGRLGRRWHSTAGSSLTFSLALPLTRADWSGLSLAVGLAVVDALDPDGHRLGLKWPNDLIWRETADEAAAEGSLGRKLGGILIESVAVGTRRAAVIGIGVNIAAQPDVDADYAVAGLAELWPDATPQGALARIAVALVAALAAFDRDGFAPLRAAFQQRDVLRGRAVTTTDASLPEGVAAGVDTDGALLVDIGAKVQRIVSGEVSVRLAPHR